MLWFWGWNYFQKEFALLLSDTLAAGSCLRISTWEYLALMGSKYHISPPASKLPEVKKWGSYAYTIQWMDYLESDTPDGKLSMSN